MPPSFYSPDSPLASIDWGAPMSDTEVSIHYAPRGGVLFYEYGYPYSSEGWNDYEIAQFTLALDRIEAVSALTFNRVYDQASADFVVGLDTDADLEWDTYGFFLPQSETPAGYGMFNGRLWDRRPGGDLEVGGMGFATIVHEVLHGLGLAHPHDRGGTSTKMDGVRRPFDDFGDYDLNQGVFTIMSYNDGWQTGSRGTKPAYSGDFGNAAGPMALDIALLQGLYGANMTTAGGNDTYHLAARNQSGTFWEAIWDTGGKDMLSYRGAKDAMIDLRAATLSYDEGGGGYISSVAGVAGGFTIAAGVVIERARSGAGDDWLGGNNSSNLLLGGGGDDVLIGRAGNDVLRGGSGLDLLKAGWGNDKVFGGNDRDVIRGGQGNDTIEAGSGNDVVRGDAGDDVLRGRQGNDWLLAGAGNDRVIGGGGADRFVFRQGDGMDRFIDFDTTRDRLVLDSGLVSVADADAVLAGARTVASGLRITFSGGERITFHGIDDPLDLAPAIHFHDGFA